jgi:hypothetical protein
VRLGIDGGRTKVDFGANPEIKDEGGAKAVDMIGTGGEGGRNATASLGAAKPVPPATMAEIRSLLSSGSSRF